MGAQTGKQPTAAATIAMMAMVTTTTAGAQSGKQPAIATTTTVTGFYFGCEDGGYKHGQASDARN